MISKPEVSLLEQIEAAGCAVDTDSMNPEIAKNLPIKPHDMTSNHLLVDEQLHNPENKELVEKTIKELKGKDWLDVHTVLSVRFAKRVLPYVSGRVLVQASPRNAYNEEAIEKHVRAYDRVFQEEGIPRERFMVKVPSTSAGVRAAKRLNAEGIRTLGTSLFSLPQAIACSQAGMHSISPYFNETRAHVEPELWPDVEDPATQHPMSARMRHIRDTYDRLAKETGKTQPLIKAASCVTAREAMAMLELGADSNTILADQMDDLCSATKLPVYKKGGEHQVRYRSLLDQPSAAWAPWASKEPAERKKRMEEIAKADPLSKVMSKDWKIASTDVDYLAPGVLDKYNEEDEVTRLRLKDALDLFYNGEEHSRQTIEKLQKEWNA
ncbi:transaldolase [Kwoniella heveanensis BCC8398]|uniref:Transaldolase n=1 Tax=Kwoniella heveanensis BCC8398 TaxID=1296120 RepID=A0A1B9GZG1_9TREE|nr:transaldolase [Kwoniella heveanensis BCC8398]